MPPPPRTAHSPGGGVETPTTLWRGWTHADKGLALTYKIPECHCWEGPEIVAGAYGTCCKQFQFQFQLGNLLAILSGSWGVDGGQHDGAHENPEGRSHTRWWGNVRSRRA
jgi:hypothetical protein